MMKRMLCAALLLLTVLSLAACKADPRASAGDAARENALREINRFRYAPLEWTFPEEYAVTSAAPLIGEDGTFSVVLQRETYRNNEYSVSALQMQTSVFTFSPEGEVLREEPIPLDKNVSILCGVLTEDDLFFTATSWGMGHATFFGRFDRLTETIAEEVPFSEIGLMPGEIPWDMAADAEGNFYLIREDGVSVVSLNREWGDVVRIPGKTPLNSLFAGEDGRVYAAVSDGNTVGIQRVNRDEGHLDPVRNFHLHAMNRVAVRSRGDWVYISAPDGIYRASMTESGGEPEKLLDFTVSGILTQSSLDGSGQFRWCMDEETLYFSESHVDAHGVRRRLPRIYRKISGEEADSCTLVQVAFSCELEDSIRTAFVLFNRAHDDIRILPLDSSNRSNPTREDYGNWQMLTEITNGVISPDLVIDRYDPLEGSFDTAAAKQLMENGLTADLGAYLDRDPDVSRDNLFGCVLRAFSDKDGAVWGITPYFGLRTWITLPDRLGGYAADGHWTVGEFLRYYEELPEEAEPCLWFTTEKCGNGLLADLGSFYDKDSGTCRFDSADFVRWLEVMVSLPDPEEYGRTSPYARMKGDELAGIFRGGSVRLSSVFLCNYVSQLHLEQVYGTKDFRFVGYPSHLDSGALIESDLIFMLMKNSPVPDAAWELVRFFFLDETLNNSMWHDEQVSLPALKSEYDRQTEYYASLSLRYYESGAIGIFPDAAVVDHSNSPYREQPLDREYIARIRAYLDGEGCPLTEGTPDAVMQIVLEELSALRAGHGSADECAGKIQSRVSIWLAENR